MGQLHLERLTLGYGPDPVVRDLTLSVADGEMMSLLGPSGAGKTTILRAVAGFIRPRAGRIRIDGRPVDHLPPERRGAVMVFQKALLFPFLDVAENIAFGLKMQGLAGVEIRRRVDAIMALTGLAGLGRRKVHEISGGQQQRAALARALVLQPAVLLLDEPLSSLDANLRQQMREFIQQVQAETRVTTLFVTHDQSEALMMSHQVSLLLDGRLRQTGTPRQLFYRPADPEVARFFGGENFFDGRMENGRLVTAFGDFPAPGVADNGHRPLATIRPEDVCLDPEDRNGAVMGEVAQTRFEGMATRIWLRCAGGTVVALASESRWTVGQRLAVVFPPDRVRIFPE
ncbi:MAG: ABC transporter ATP-binding protein [Desulfobacteraceae bacterium]|jgi:ABC-type Fe3+/spermidine/putrescine transport system ATPase subunit|nr:ABC transporter ATP-binding protein [Desulfobacteraceae bacterium]